MSPYEIVGVTFGLASVVLTVRATVWSWPVGLVSVLAFGVLFFGIKLYADVALQAFFLVTGIAGWWSWLHGGDSRAELPIRRLSARSRLVVAACTAPAVVATWGLLSAFTDASLPGWDSLASGLSVVAQLLLVRKFVESWVLWIAVDIVSIGIYLAKGVFLTAGLYVIFLALAILGLRSWYVRSRVSEVAQ